MSHRHNTFLIIVGNTNSLNKRANLALRKNNKICTLPTPATITAMVSTPTNHLFTKEVFLYQRATVSDERKAPIFTSYTNVPGNNANYVVSSTTKPFTVFGAPYSSGCPGQAITVTSSGTLKSIVANISYSTTSGVHGLALSSDNRFIYSGDDMGGAVWAHSYDATSNKVSKVQQLNVTGNPRHLVVSPQGSYVYVMLETGNKVAVFTRDSRTGRIAATNTTFSTIPPGKFLSNVFKRRIYRAAVTHIIRAHRIHKYLFILVG